MKLTLWQRLDAIARSMFPVTATLLLILASMVPLRIPDLAPIIPSLSLIAVYYWTIHRPDLMPIWAVFAIGVTQDLLSGAMLGVGSIALLLVRHLVISQARFFTSASFVVIWSIFALVALFAFFMMWLLTSLSTATLVEHRPATFQYLMTLAVYPCFTWLFVHGQRLFLR